MGLVINIERWELPAAIAMATEGIRAKYNDGVGGGGFGAADNEIGAKLDSGKVLAAVDEISKTGDHLSDWVLFAYASPMWNRKALSTRFMNHLVHDWAADCLNKNINIQLKLFKRMEAILPLVAGGFALEQASGAGVESAGGELNYRPITRRASLIEALVDHDCIEARVNSETFKKKRRRYYQTHWDAFSSHIDLVRTILMRYDAHARKLFRSAIAK